MTFYTGTGDSASVARYIVDIQDEPWLIEAFMGAMDFLGVPEQWKEVGSITRDVAAERSNDALVTFRRDSTVIGSIILSATASAPANTLLCDGASYLKSDYPELVAVLNSVFFSDSTHFVTPNQVGLTGLNYYLVVR